MFCKETVIRNKTGLHARPASEFIAMAKRFSCNIWIEPIRAENVRKINAKSMIHILSLGLVQDTHIRISAEGEDAEQAVQALTALVESGLGE